MLDKGQDPDTDGYSGFEATGLEELLRERDVDKLTVVGLATDYCVQEHRARRAARRASRWSWTRRACAGWRSRRATPSGRSQELREAGRLGVDASWDRMLASMRVFFRPVGAATEGYRCIERDGVLATVTPAVPDRSLPNSVVYESEDALAAMLGELAELYEDAGVRAWTVWMPFARRGDALAARGRRPRARRRSGGDDRRPRGGGAAAAGRSRAGPRPAAADDSARINDEAYGAEGRVRGAGRGAGARPRRTTTSRASSTARRRRACRPATTTATAASGRWRRCPRPAGAGSSPG